MYRITPEMASRLRFIKPALAAQIYGMHINTMYKKIKSDGIVHIRIDGSVRVAVWADDYQKWIEQQKEETLKKDADNNKEHHGSDDIKDL